MLLILPVFVTEMVIDRNIDFWEVSYFVSLTISSIVCTWKY